MILNFINDNMPLIISLLGTILTAVGGFFAKKYHKRVNTKRKEQIVWAVVRFVEMKFKGSPGEEKLIAALNNAQSWLKSEGIKFDKTEIEILIESFVYEFKNEK